MWEPDLSVPTDVSPGERYRPHSCEVPARASETEAVVWCGEHWWRSQYWYKSIEYPADSASVDSIDESLSGREASIHRRPLDPTVNRFPSLTIRFLTLLRCIFLEKTPHHSTGWSLPHQKKKSRGAMMMSGKFIGSKAIGTADRREKDTPITRLAWNGLGGGGGGGGPFHRGEPWNFFPLFE